MRTQLLFDARFNEPRKFTGIAYSGGVIPGYGRFGNVAIDLSTAQIPPKAFALLDHDQRQRAGVAMFERVGHEIITQGQLLDNKFGNEIAEIAAQGGPWQLSVGITADTIPAKKPTEINGQLMDVSHIFSNAIIREVSFVTAGADPNTAVAVFGQQREEYELELAELRRERILSAYPQASAEQIALIGALPRAVFTAVMQLAGKRQTANAVLSAMTAPVGKAHPAAPAGVDPERYAINLRAEAVMVERKTDYQSALKFAYQELDNAHSV